MLFVLLVIFLILAFIFSYLTIASLIMQYKAKISNYTPLKTVKNEVLDLLNSFSEDKLTFVTHQTGIIVYKKSYDMAFELEWDTDNKEQPIIMDGEHIDMEQFYIRFNDGLEEYCSYLNSSLRNNSSDMEENIEELTCDKCTLGCGDGGCSIFAFPGSLNCCGSRL